MPPRDNSPFPEPPRVEDTAPVGPCAPFESPDSSPPITLPERSPTEVEGKVTEAMEAVGARLEEELRKMVDGFNVIVDAVRRFADIGMLGPEIVEAARVILEKLREIIEAAIDVVLYIMEHYAPLAALSLTSFNWLGHVMKPMSGLPGLMMDDRSDNLIKWKGEAATLYWNKIKVQREAAAHIGALGEKFSTWLKEVFEANIGYTKPLLDLLAKLAGLIGQAAAKAGTGFGIPDAIDALKDGLGEIIETSAKYVLGAVERIVDAGSKSQELLTYLSDAEKLPGGNWPQAVRN